jgi:hypothetical protein
MKSRLSIREKRALCVLTLVVLISRCAFVFLNDHLMFGTVFVDDAFYALSVARHVAFGHGFTADGVHPTNGFQPLNTLLQSLCFLVAGGDRFNGIRWCFVLSALIEVAFIWAFASLISNLCRGKEAAENWWQSPAVIVATMQTFIFSLLAIHANGMETALDALMIVLVISSFQIIQIKRDGGNIPNIADFLRVGILCGLLVLSRIDGAVLVLIVVLFEIRFPNGFRNALLVGGMALLISSPWWIYCQVRFGSLMPISGQSESIFSWHTLALLDAANAAQAIFLFWIPKWRDQFTPWVSLPLAVFGFFLMIQTIRRFEILKAIRTSYDLRLLKPFGFFAMFLVVYYTFIFRAPWFLERYWHPIELVWLMLLSFVIAELTTRIGNFISPRRTSIVMIGVVVIIIVATINLRMERRVYFPAVPADLAEIGFWARANPNVTVGTLQSGAAGFLADNVTNLDGKVNLEALLFRKHDSLGAYIRKMRFDYLADEKGSIGLALQDTSRFGYHYQLVDSIRSVRIFRRVTAPDLHIKLN